MKNKISNIKVCAFDAYGTCFDINSAAKLVKNKIGKSWLEFSNTWRTTQLEYTWLRSLMKNHRDFWKITKDSLDYAMKVHSIKPKYKKELLKLYKELEVYPELKKTLLYLKKKKIKCCILSNGTPKLLEQLTKRAQIEKLFDSIISIEEVKIYKPDPRVYQLVTQKYSCKPREVCFLSSNSWDVVGSRSYGFQSIWVNRVNKIFDNLDFKPKKTISNLIQLKKIL
tara:strand:+ start:412 stop:1086 length:675 start_codon:yes stop_codon:yes gene_type:complete